MTAAEHGSTVAHQRVKTLLEFLNKLPGACHLQGCNQLLFRGFLVVDDVVTHGAVEQERVLTHKANRLTKRVQGVGGDGLPVDQHFPAIGRVVAHDEFEDGRFSGTRVPHDAEEITVLNLERNTVQDLDGGVRVSEVHIVEFNGSDTAFQGNGSFLINDGWLEVNGGKHAPGGGFTTLELIDENAKDEHRHGHSRADEQEGHQLTGGDFSRAGEVSTGGHEQTKRHARNGVNHRNEAVSVFACPHGLVAVRARFCCHPVGFPVFGVVGLDHGDTRNEVLENGMDVACGFTLLAVLSLNTGGKPVHGGDDEQDGPKEDGCQLPRHQHENDEGRGKGDDDTDDRC